MRFAVPSLCTPILLLCTNAGAITFGPPVLLDAAAGSNDPQACVATDREATGQVGRLHTAWVRQQGLVSTIVYQREATLGRGNFSTPVLLARPSGATVRSLDLAVDSASVAHLCWLEGELAYYARVSGSMVSVSPELIPPGGRTPVTFGDVRIATGHPGNGANFPYVAFLAIDPSQGTDFDVYVTARLTAGWSAPAILTVNTASETFVDIDLVNSPANPAVVQGGIVYQRGTEIFLRPTDGVSGTELFFAAERRLADGQRPALAVQSINAVTYVGHLAFLSNAAPFTVQTLQFTNGAPFALSSPVTLGTSILDHPAITVVQDRATGDVFNKAVAVGFPTSETRLQVVRNTGGLASVLGIVGAGARDRTAFSDSGSFTNAAGLSTHPTGWLANTNFGTGPKARVAFGMGTTVQLLNEDGLPTPTATASPSPSATTASPTPTGTSNGPSPSPTRSPSATATISPTGTATPLPSISPSPTATGSPSTIPPTASPSPSPIPTRSPTPSATLRPTASPSFSPTPSMVATATGTPREATFREATDALLRARFPSASVDYDSNNDIAFDSADLRARLFAP